MAFLMSAVDVAAPSGLWEWFILDVFDFIVNYGWRVVLLTILLKLALSPLDFYQKYKMRKNQRITEELMPQMEKLKKQYQNDPAMLNQKQSELQKKAGFSFFSACIPMILTLVLFITFFNALRSVSAYMEFKQYVEMYDEYVAEYQTSGFDYKTRVNGSSNYLVTVSENIEYDEITEWLENVFQSDESVSAIVDENSQIFDGVSEPVRVLTKYKTEYIDAGLSYRDYISDISAIDKESESLESKTFNVAMSKLMQVRAKAVTPQAYLNSRTSFLWIKSLWVADVPWKNSLPDYDTFKANMGRSDYLDWNKNAGNVYSDDQTLFNDLIKEETYNIVTSSIREDSSIYKTNGYLIIVVLVVAMSFLSQFISGRQQKKAGQVNEAANGTLKMMMWMMPIMLAYFAISQSSAFTLYMLTNSLISLIINFITSLIVNLLESRNNKKSKVIKYGRTDPNDKYLK